MLGQGKERKELEEMNSQLMRSRIILSENLLAEAIQEMTLQKPVRAAALRDPEATTFSLKVHDSEPSLISQGSAPPYHSR